MNTADLRMCNTDDLRVLVKTADRRHLNRVPVLPDALDPDGTHLLHRILYGHNMDNPGVPLHHRCRLLMKVTGTDEPVETILDVLDTDYNTLPQPTTT